MTIEQLKEQEEGNYTFIQYHEGVSRVSMEPIPETDVDESDYVRDYWLEPSDGDTTLHILVQPYRVLKYIHVGAPAPQYALKSIRSICSAIVDAAVDMGIYEREEPYADGIRDDIILVESTTDEQVAELFAHAERILKLEGCTDTDHDECWLTYDAGRADLRESEPTRFW